MITVLTYYLFRHILCTGRLPNKTNSSKKLDRVFMTIFWTGLKVIGEPKNGAL